MSIYSTLTVSRDAALLAKARLKWGYLSDEQLGDKLDKHVRDSLHNVVVGGRDKHADDFRLLEIISED